MFPKNKRLTKDLEIKKVFKKGENYKSPFFILKFLSWKSLKITIIVSKKNIKLAVNRNRTKRIFRSAIIEILKEYKITWSIIFLPSANTLNKKSSEIKTQIKKAFECKKILKKL